MDLFLCDVYTQGNIVAPVPTPGTRILRSGLTGHQRSQRKKRITLTTTKRNTRKKKESFKVYYDDALDNLRRSKKSSQTSTNEGDVEKSNM